MMRPPVGFGPKRKQVWCRVGVLRVGQDSARAARARALSAHSFEKSARAARTSTGVPLGKGLTTTAELNPYLFHGPLPVSSQYKYGGPIPKAPEKLIVTPIRTPAFALALGDHRGNA